MVRNLKEVSTFGNHQNYWKLLQRKGDDKIDIQTSVFFTVYMSNNNKHKQYKSNQKTNPEENINFFGTLCNHSTKIVIIP